MTETSHVRLEFTSVLVGGRRETPAADDEPAAFRDLNLDQVVAAITAGRDEYDLKRFFHATLSDVDTVNYRHEVFRDLESAATNAAVRGFADEMRRVRRYLTLAKKQHHTLEQKRWFLDAAAAYCDAVTSLATALAGAQPRSRALSALADYLDAHTRSDRFRRLRAEVQDVLDGLSGVRYAIRIKGARVTVTTYEHEPDYSIDVSETFARFRQGAVEERLVKVPDSGSMDHVEEQIAQRVARLHPSEFRALDEFCARNRELADPTILRFDQELQFFLSYREFVERLEAAGVAFTYPRVSDTSKEIAVNGGVDVALATKLAGTGGRLVPNDLHLSEDERIAVVTGPNQGGKTTFARMFGQLHHLAAIGVPVPAQDAQLFLADAVHTHFEREEDISTLRGKLEDELVRIRDVLERATSDSVVIVNEIFAATTLADAVRLGTSILEQLVERDCLAVCVTFLDELATLGPTVVSVVAQVAPDDPSRRTFRLIRTPADGRAYALAIADKYGLSYERLRKRVGS